MAADETIQCVDSIVQNVAGEKKVIVIDNASPNQSFAVLEKQYRDSDVVDVIKTNENLGFAKGNNVGYELAVKQYDPDFIVVMNNDMEIKQTDFIAKINESYQKFHFDIMGPDVYSTKKQYHQNPQTRRILSLKELKSRYQKLVIKEKLLFLVRLKYHVKSIIKNNRASAEDSKKNIPFVNEPRENVLLHGSCYVFSRPFIEKNPKECFYPETFMYMEAEILYYLAQKNGDKITYDPSMRVDHHEDVSTDATFKSYQKSIFSIRCLKQSTKAFIDLMERTDN